jgi:hypothetical protein
MDQHIAVGMGNTAFDMLYLYSSQPKLLSFGQPVHIISESYPYLHFLRLSPFFAFTSSSVAFIGNAAALSAEFTKVEP